MTSVIINDASCLIDLRKGGLVEVLCNLPYRFIVPLPIRESEVLDFSNQQWKHLDDNGMITHDLTPEEVKQAFEFKKYHPSLSSNDCFCYVTARVHAGMLLTGDALLRRIACENGLRVHGVLWVIDELVNSRACGTSLLIKALRAWQSDDTVFLPPREIIKRLEYLTTGVESCGTKGDEPFPPP